MVLWDCPGFGDLAGTEQDIVNAYAIKKVFDNSKNIRVVLVCSYASIEDNRGETLIMILNQLASLFCDDI